jgi:serine/threonine protein phosphatase PrpC
VPTRIYKFPEADLFAPPEPTAELGPLGEIPKPPESRTETPSEAEAEPGIIEKLMIEAAGVTDPGCVRTNNEDYYLVAPSIGLYVVADGMGGAQAGEHASKLAAETVWELIYQSNGSVDRDLLVHSFQEANRRVMQASLSDPAMEGMGTTLVAAAERGGELLIASVGDSRAYVFEKGALIPITEDQTWVNEVGRRLGIDEENLKSHPMRHVLTMAIGVSENLRVHTYRVQPAPGARILICSDGLHGVAQEEEIVAVLSAGGTLEEQCQRLVEVARERGGPDNITVVLLKAT